MKLKQLLPITALVAVSPATTLAISCSKDIDIDLENCPEKGYLTPSHTINLKKNQLYDLSIDLEDVPLSFRESITTIKSWSIFVSEDGKTPITKPFNITHVKIWLNNKRKTQNDWFRIDGNKIISLKPIESTSWGDVWDTEIDVDIKISSSIPNSNFVFNYTGE